MAAEPGIDVELPGGPDAPGQARDAIRRGLGARLSDDERFEIELLVTELVTNAVRHGGMTRGRRIGLRLRLGPDTLRIEVRDDGPGFERVPPRPRDVEHGGGGLGLVLLDRFAREWGVERAASVQVWADIPRHAGRAARPG